MLRDELRARGFAVLPGETAIVPVVIEKELDLCRLCKQLLEEGIYINPVLRTAAAQNLLRILGDRGARPSACGPHTHYYVGAGGRIRIGYREIAGSFWLSAEAIALRFALVNFLRLALIPSDLPEMAETIKAS